MRFLENAHALVIGIAGYTSVRRLSATVLNDARDLYAALVDPERGAYRADSVELLLDAQATGEAIRKALTSLAARSNENSTVFIYFSGHGARLASGAYQGEYLLPVDTSLSDEKHLAGTAISGSEFAAALRGTPARKLVLLLDCCHAAGLGEPKGIEGGAAQAGLSERYLEELQRGRGRVVIASCREDEQSYVLPGANNSVFTEHVLAGLAGGVPAPAGLVRIFDLFDYVQPRVVKAHPKQHPIFKAELEENFPIALSLGGKSPSPVPQAEPPPSDGFNLDAFVSFAPPQKPWVSKKLVPAFKAAGLRVKVEYEYEPGEFIVKQIENAVQRCRYTIAVLSPAYLENGFTEFETILAEHIGFEQRRRRYIGVLREPCQPTLSVRSRFWLDMTDDNDFDEAVERLIFEIKRPLQVPTTA
jgi:hypothetical protein